jgi:hypothetical protein
MPNFMSLGNGDHSAMVSGSLAPESEVCTLDQGVTCVSRFSMMAIIASLAKPMAVIASAS